MSQGAVVNALLNAYRSGYFPMADPGAPRRERIGWYNPDPRAIIPIAADDPAGTFHVPASLAQRVRSGRFRVRTDTAFHDVIRACARPRSPEDDTWISEEIVHAYAALHEEGHAHSVEAWSADGQAERLVGGLYGVAVGGLFAGESMFSSPREGGTDASKVCLVHLVGHLRRRGFTLLDTQFWNPHLEQFGCVLISREDFLARLRAALRAEPDWLPFDWSPAPGDVGAGVR